MSSQLRLRRGSSVSHSTFTGVDGELTFNTDTNALVTHDGATPGGFPHLKAADLIASTGATLVGANAYQTQDAFNKEHVSVKAYGALGNDSATDTAAFLAAIATGKNVYIGGFENIYRINAPLTLAVGQKIFGSGARIRRMGSGNTFVLDNYSEVENITIMSDGVSTSQVGIYINDKSRTKVRGCSFVGLLGDGYHVENIIDFHQGNILTDSMFTGCTIGINIAERGEYTVVVGCTIDQCGTGIKIIGGNSNVSSCNISNCTTGVLVGSGANDAHGRVANCLINHSVQYAIKVDSITVPEFQFEACTFYYGSVWLRYCSGVKFNNCVSSNNTFYFEEALFNYFTNCHFVNTPTLNHRWLGTQSYVQFVDCTYPSSVSGDSVFYANSAFVRATLTGSHVSVPDSATEQVLALNTRVYNTVGADLNFTYLTFYNTTTNTFENLKSAKSVTHNFALNLSSSISIGSNTGPAPNFALVEIYIKNAAGMLLGTFTKPPVTNGPSGSNWGVFTFNGTIPLQDSFQIFIMNRTGGAVTFWAHQTTVPSFIEVTGF